MQARSFLLEELHRAKPQCFAPGRPASEVRLASCAAGHPKVQSPDRRFLLGSPAGTCSGRDSRRGSASAARSGVVTDSGSSAGGVSCVCPHEGSAAGARLQDVRSRCIIVLQVASHHLRGFCHTFKHVWCSRDVGHDRSCSWSTL